ncbi:MAG: membrane dipeptidase [Candidatus Fermentibacteraceae bacterium]
MDTLLRLGDPDDFRTGAGTHADGPRCREAGVRDLVGAVCAEGESDWRRALDRGMKSWRALRDMERPRLHLMLEGAEPLARLDDPEPILEGLEMATLTWNPANSLAGGVQSDSGLTAEGRSWVRRLESLGVLLDVSHLCARSRRDLLSVAEGPVVASHSNAAGLCDHPRNLPDADIRELAGRGGLVGITFVPSFLGGDAGMDTVMDHLSYVADLVGTEAVAFGSDFDGIGRLPRDIEGCQSWPGVLEAMAEKGFTDEEIRAVAADNWRRLLGSEDSERGGSS